MLYPFNKPAQLIKPKQTGRSLSDNFGKKSPAQHPSKSIDILQPMPLKAQANKVGLKNIYSVPTHHSRNAATLPGSLQGFGSYQGNQEPLQMVAKFVPNQFNKTMNVYNPNRTDEERKDIEAKRAQSSKFEKEGKTKSVGRLPSGDKTIADLVEASPKIHTTFDHLQGIVKTAQNARKMSPKPNQANPDRINETRAKSSGNPSTL